MTVPKSHPRYESLMQRERIIEGNKAGIVADAGLIAQGRGEAFDYLIGEKTTEPAEKAERAAVIAMLLAKNPVISINGNVAVLAPEAIVGLSKALPAKVEVNIFYRTEERMKAIFEHMKKFGLDDLLGLEPDASIPNLESNRAKCSNEGIFSSDVIFVPLEDGDRCEALVAMGKTVVCVDLNPFSRSARMSHITIVDNLVRAVPNMIRISEELKGTDEELLRKELDEYSNEGILSSASSIIRSGID